MHKLSWFFVSIFFLSRAVAQEVEKREVRMYEQIEISYNIGDVFTKSISTKGLRGCIAVGLIEKYNSEDFNVIMSHYPPFGRATQLKKLESQLNNSSYKPIKQKLIILVPNEPLEAENIIPNKLELSHIKNIEKIVGIESEIVPYKISEKIDMEKKSLPYFEILLKQGLITWKSFADNYSEHKF